MKLQKLFYGFGLILVISSSSFFAQDSGKKSVWFELQRQVEVPTHVLQWYVFSDQQAAITSSEIILYQESGSQNIPLPPLYVKTVFSKNGRFLAIVTLNPRHSTQAVDRELRILVFSISDFPRELYQITRTVYFDRVMPLIVLDDKNGSVILGESDSGELWFYDQSGIVITQVALFPDAEYDLEKILDVDISEDGSRVAVVAGKRGGSPAGSEAVNPNAEPHLFYFTGDGEELWRKALPDFNSNEVAISPNGHHLIVNSFTIFTNGRLMKKTLIFNTEGAITYATDLLFKHARFSPDSRQVLLAENNQFQLVDMELKESLWQQKTSRQDGIFIDGEISNQSGITAVLIAENLWENEQFISSNPQILLINLDGQLLQRINYAGQKTVKPALCYQRETESLIVGVGDSYYIYQKK